MPEWTSEAKIAAGNDNAGALALVTSLTTSPAIPFLEPQTVLRNWKGIPRVATTGMTRRSGSKRCEWVSSQLWIVQLKYLVDTFEGEVTIRTTFDGITWANYNAVLYCGDKGDYGTLNAETQYGFAISDFVWHFSRVVAI